MRRRLPRRAALAGLALGAVALAGCGGGDATVAATAGGAPSSQIATDLAAAAEGRTLIDVRTADEVADGIVDGAIHLDVQDPAFEERVAELPRDEPYLVYCRTGNRSGQAIDRMRALGFEDLVNGGAYEDMVEAGLPVA